MKILEKLSIKIQLLIIAASTVSIMLFIILSSYTQIIHAFTAKNDAYVEELSYQLEKKLAANCDLINRITKNIAFNPVIQDYLLEEKLDRKYEYFKTVEKYIGNMKSMKDGIIDIAIIGTDGSMYYQREGSLYFDYSQLDMKDRVSVYYSSMVEYKDSKVRKNCFVAATNIVSIDINSKYNQIIGKVLLFIDVNSILGNTEDVSKQKEIKLYLIDRSGKTFLTNETANDLAVDLDIETIGNSAASFHKTYREKYIIGTEKLPYIDGKLVSVVPKKELLYDLSEIRKHQLQVIIIAFMILSIPFAAVVMNILHPLNEFKKFTTTINSGNIKTLKQRIKLGGYSEMKSVAGEFNSMMGEIDNLTHRLLATSSKLYEAELEKKQAELANLRSQINPHFLYNTLESIKGIAAEKEVPQIINMTKALGKVFRYSVKGADKVTLEEELSVAKSYIYLQQIRFEERFCVAYELSGDSLACMVPRMILQPIVENAIFYGLETTKKKGRLTISADIRPDGCLMIIVKDDGMGMSKQKLGRIQEYLADHRHSWEEKPENRMSIGLNNVSNRLKLMYGDAYGLSIESETGKGTQVTYLIPAERRL